MTSAIQLSNVTVRRDGRPVIDDVSLSIAAGTIHLIVGPNGAGKSTLLSALLGQLPFEGQIRLRFSAGGGDRIGYVPQSFVADRTTPITLAEFYALSRQRLPICLGIRRAVRPRIAAALAKVGLAGKEQRRLGELSGGELRRALIGNAIDPAPALLLCDEPAAGLDAEAIAELDRTLVELRDHHGTTIVMVSHDRAQIRRIADHVTELGGKVCRTGSANEVLPALPGNALDATSGAA